jgi:LmbE family N-acetylglucosaminyl deacetylase
MDMEWIFLSPHLDDAAFSCGGLIWDLTSAGQDVEIWTCFAGDPDPETLSPLATSLHKSWELSANAYQIRRQEDLMACEVLGAGARHLPYLDCIYRQTEDGEHYYTSGEAIFGGLDSREADLIDLISSELAASIPAGATIAAPLGIGNHVDHEIIRKAANRLSNPPYYYADYPYAREQDGKEILDFLATSQDWHPERYQVSEKGLEKWFEASRAYASQLAVFWQDDDALRTEIDDFSAFLGGMKLWKTLPED